MPELPEVETVRTGLSPYMVGQKIIGVEQRRPDLRFPFPDRFTQRLIQRRIMNLGRRAKYLLAELDNDEILVMHLGMSGSFRIGGKITGQFHHDRSRLPAHDHVVFSLENGAVITYNDPRRFGFMQLISRQELPNHKFFSGLGLEPLGNALDGQALASLFASKAAPLKAALLDQSLIAGLGNIYVCEALHRAGLSPRRAAGTLVRADGSPTQRADLLAQVIREVLQEAVKAGGSSLRDHRQANGTLGYFQHGFRVYDREGESCSRESCKGHIKRIVQSGRSTFFCSQCQR
jgi:formamidopyrimidine-DNA glycosylase